jgi:hypothetical protein
MPITAGRFAAMALAEVGREAPSLGADAELPEAE